MTLKSSCWNWFHGIAEYSCIRSHSVIQKTNQLESVSITLFKKTKSPLYTIKLVVLEKKDVPEKLFFRPGIDRQRPHHMELRITLPANSVTEVEWEFHKGFLKWTEYPPDAHRGFDLGPAVISAMLPVARNWTGIPRHVSTFDQR